MAKAKLRFNHEEIQQKQKDEEPKGFEKDTRFWKPSLAGDKERSYLIRFMPDPSGITSVKYQDHSFDYYIGETKKKYWKKCINTFGFDKECPICKQSWEYKDSAFENDKKLGGERCRKLHYVSNIYVIKDDYNPENNGKVFLYDYGKSVFDKLNSKSNPTAEDLKDPEFVKFFPSDFFEGADFFLKIKEKGKFPNGNQIPNFEESKFLKQSSFLGGDEDKIEAQFDLTVALDEFRDESKYPTNEEVIKQIGFVLGLAPAPPDSKPKNESSSGSAGLFGDAPEDDIPDFTPDDPSDDNDAPPFDADEDDTFFADMKK
jgi:hypothetical protein